MTDVVHNVAQTERRSPRSWDLAPTSEPERQAGPTTPAASICIPVYNGGKYLRATLESVLSQTLKDLEIVVVDNASTDSTTTILSSFDDERMRVIRNDEMVNVYENWTRAVAATTGPYVKCVAADDLLRPACMERQVDAFERHGEGVVLVASKRDIVTSAGHVLIPHRGLGRLSGRIPGQVAIARCVRRGTNIFGEGAAVLAHGDSIRAALPWPSDYPYMTDLVMWFRLLEEGDLVAVREPLAAFRAHDGSWSASVISAQAVQARELFESVARAPESSVGPLELHIGRVRAAMLARLRPLAYLRVVSVAMGALASLRAHTRR